ncbi:hypothetical protein, partial [Klebsiella pneumoniae]|uniref:hypothetical protein n=1 Tax=Klebsiella pneumoniae TaxID=573 RepID=UPI003F567E96
GSQYFDDVGFVDVTDALAIEANASATNALTSRVSSVEGTITSQGQQITSMQNSIKKVCRLDSAGGPEPQIGEIHHPGGQTGLWR